MAEGQETGVRVAVLEWNAGGQETVNRLVGSVSAPGEETLGPAWYAVLLRWLLVLVAAESNVDPVVAVGAGGRSSSAAPS